MKKLFIAIVAAFALLASVTPVAEARNGLARQIRINRQLNRIAFNQARLNAQLNRANFLANRQLFLQAQLNQAQFNNAFFFQTPVFVGNPFFGRRVLFLP